MESLEDRIQRAIGEEIAIEPYDPGWPESFRREREHLLGCLPNDLVERIEHFGSTAVPGLAAKPIIDILVGVASLAAARERIVPILEAQGYEYFWRPTSGDQGPPWYAWFIKRDPATGKRTHHLHLVEASFTEHWDRLLFRDFLISHPEIAAEYAALKKALASQHPHDRVQYTQRKTEFVAKITDLAKRSRDRSTQPQDSNLRGLVRPTVYWTLAMEGVFCLMRFGFGLESTRDTASTIGRLTLGLRIHHGYLGLLIAPLALVIARRSPLVARYLLVLGAALVLSDLIHHFLVLWPLTGSPHFHLWYPALG